MPRKVLGQQAGAGALTQLYKVPTSTQAIISTLVLLNRNTSADAAVRVTVAPADAADAAQHTLVDQTLAPGGRLTVTEGWTLAATDAIRANLPTGVVATLFGSETAA